MKLLCIVFLGAGALFGQITTYPAASGGASATVTINTQTGTAYTLVASDLGKVISFTNASPVTVTIPLSLAAGFNCSILQSGAGTVSVVAAASVTLNLMSGLLSTAVQYATATIWQTATDTYVLGGALK